MDTSKEPTRNPGAFRLPHKIQVVRLVRTRYGDGNGSERPASWDARLAGPDVVEALDGSLVHLQSTAMQSSPKPGWILMLTEGDDVGGYHWTLYGMSRCQ